MVHEFCEKRFIVTVSAEDVPMTAGLVLELFGLLGVVLTNAGSFGGVLS